MHRRHAGTCQGVCQDARELSQFAQHCNMHACSLRKLSWSFDPVVEADTDMQLTPREQMLSSSEPWCALRTQFELLLASLRPACR